MPAYAAFLVRRSPDAIVLCRDEHDAPCHASEQALVALPSFRTRYRETRRFGRDLFPQAHYVVYERRSALAGEEKAPPPRSAGPARRADAGTRPRTYRRRP